MVVTPEAMEVKMNDSTESARSAPLAVTTVVRSRGDHASSHSPLAREERATASTESREETVEAVGEAAQLSLFPAPAEPPQLRATLFHIRCHDCQAINDVPSLPTICYACRCPLGREHPPF